MDGRLPAIGAALELAQCALLSLRFNEQRKESPDLLAFVR
jgi:hypothetical protein